MEWLAVHRLERESNGESEREREKRRMLACLILLGICLDEFCSFINETMKNWFNRIHAEVLSFIRRRSVNQITTTWNWIGKATLTWMNCSSTFPLSRHRWCFDDQFDSIDNRHCRCCRQPTLFLHHGRRTRQAQQMVNFSHFSPQSPAELVDGIDKIDRSRISAIVSKARARRRREKIRLLGKHDLHKLEMQRERYHLTLDGDRPIFDLGIFSAECRCDWRARGKENIWIEEEKTAKDRQI